MNMKFPVKKVRLTLKPKPPDKLKVSPSLSAEHRDKEQGLLPA